MSATANGIGSMHPIPSYGGTIHKAAEDEGSRQSDTPSSTSQTMEISSCFDATTTTTSATTSGSTRRTRISSSSASMEDKSVREEGPPLQCAITSVTVPSLRMLERVELKEPHHPPPVPPPLQITPLTPQHNERVTSVGSACSQSNAELDWTFLKENRLYGRETEMQQLQEAFNRRLDLAEAEEDKSMTNTGHGSSCTSSSSLNGSFSHNVSHMMPELVLVSGKSGTGKTVLVKKALQKLVVEDHDGHFIVGKFDQLQTPEPYGPFVAALTQLLVVLEQSYFQNMDGLRKRILRRVGVDAVHVLCCLVPALGRVLGIQQDGDGERSAHAALSAQQDRLKVALKKFFAAICSSSEPLVLVLDDLQWSDSGSLVLLEALVSESIRGLVVVGICRDNEVPWHHSFAGMLRRLEDDHAARIVHLELMNLPMDATNELLADMLHQPLDVCQPLAKVIHEKSQGNVLFILQILKTLYAEQVLVSERIIDTQYSSYQWMWRQDEWNESFANLDIVELVSYQIKRLPESCQQLLQTAACIGAEFDVTTLAKLLDSNSNGNGLVDDNSNSNNNNSKQTDEHIRQILATALEEQMVVQQMHRPNKYSFSHDRVQQSAYALIPEQERAMTHLTVGRSLLQAFTEDELQDNLFLVVNQLSWGIPLLTSEIDKNGLAELCLRAGLKASQASDFETALQYFRTGTDLLSNRHWRDEYHLSLELFNCQAQAQSACGDIDGMNQTLNEILDNCRTQNDQVAAHMTRMHSLGSRSKFQEAIDIGFPLLGSLGERIPSKPRLIYLIADILKVKRLLKSKTDSDILSLPMMDIDSKNKMIAMLVLKLVCLYAFCGRQDYFAFLILRMVKLTMKHGLCPESPYGFACYGMVLCALGEFDDAWRYGELSLRLVDQDTSMNCDLLPRVHFVVYGAIAPWKQPLRSTFDPIRSAIAKAMDLCDHECFVFSSYSLCMQIYLAGENLTVTEEELNQYMEIIAHFKQGPWLALASLLRTILRNWQGKAENPLALDFASEDTQQDFNKFNFQLKESTLNAHRLCLSYHFGDIDCALATAKAVRGAEEHTKSTFFVTHMYLYDGMSSLEAAHRGQKRKHLAQAKKVIKKLESLATHCPENLLHNVYLLRGEVQAVKGNLPKAMDWYKKAMDNAESQRFLQYQALANERAGVAHQRLGTGESGATEAVRYLKRAVSLYDEWGAASIVGHLKDKHGL